MREEGEETEEDMREGERRRKREDGEEREEDMRV